MKSKIFIIPGFKELITDPQYKNLKQCLSEKHTVVLVPITWQRKVMSDYVAKATTFMNGHIKPGEKFDVLGFSFGAMIAFITAPYLKPQRLFLCSLSPYFKEDIPNIKNSWKNFIGHRRVTDFMDFSFKK